jgi:integrase
MPLNKLNVARIKAANTTGFYNDGGGLYLQVTADTATWKSWVFRYQRDKRRRMMGLGPTHAVSLAEAREAATALRKLVLKGVDPLADRDRHNSARGSALRPNFQVCAEQYIEAHRSGWKNDKHAVQWPSSLENYVYPIMGKVAANKIETSDVLEVLEPIWTTKNPTATRVRGRIEKVLDWAKARGLSDGENPARWAGHLEHLLAKPKAVHKEKHHAALDFNRIPELMRQLRSKSSISAKALELTILTAVRTTESIGSNWDEIDLPQAAWNIDKVRVKTDRDYRVPLSDRAQEIVKSLDPENPLLFPAPTKPDRPITNMAMSKLLKDLGYKSSVATVHGFRSTFRDWAAEKTDYANEVCEQAIGHRISDKAERAYRRGDMFKKRQSLMADWAAFCAG